MWFIYAISAAILWGLSYSLSEKILHSKISPQTLLALTMLAGSITFFSFSFFTQWKNDMTLILEKREISWLVFSEIVISVMANFLISLSIKAKDATLAGIIELSYPIFTILFTWLLFKENHLTPGVIAGGSLIFLGILSMAYF